MATFFGEVLSANSRAMEDDDEDYTVWPDIKLCENIDHLQLQDVKLVLFACNATACAIARSFLVGLNQGKKVLTVVKVYDNNENNSDLAVVYQNLENEDVIVVLCEEKPLKEIYASPVVDKIFDYLNLSSNVPIAVLSSENWNDYKNVNDFQFQAALLRCLTTKGIHNGSNVSSLEQPNIVSGITAAVLRECENRNIPAIAYICYETASDSDSMTVLSSVLKMWPFNRYEFNVNLDQISYPVPKFFERSNQ